MCTRECVCVCVCVCGVDVLPAGSVFILISMSRSVRGWDGFENGEVGMGAGAGSTLITQGFT